MKPEEMKEMRKTLGLTRDGLADRLDVRADTIVDWERGKKPIPVGVVADLRDVAQDRIDEIQAAMDEEN
jgi:DNA-binding transcriptional regulator YiaG